MAEAIFYWRPRCGFCMSLRSQLERAGVPFEERNIWDSDEDAAFVRSVANVTRRDAREFLALASKVPIRTHVQLYDLADTNRALADLRGGRFHGAAVVKL